MDEQQNAGSAGGTPPMADMLGSLLSNPDLLKRMGSIIGAMQSANAGENTPNPVPPPQGDPAVATEKHNDEAPTASSGIPIDGLASILSDPAMMEKLPGIIAAMKPLLNSMPPPQASPPKKSHSSPDECRDHLLLALKPFLSPERRDAVDSILRISKLGTVFKQLK